jgi:hypothetical protein
MRLTRDEVRVLKAFLKFGKIRSDYWGVVLAGLKNKGLIDVKVSYKVAGKWMTEAHVTEEGRAELALYVLKEN